jgi:hypothetical protein
MKRNPAGAGQMDFLRSRQSFSTTPALQSPGLLVKSKQLSAFSATLGFWNVAYHCEKGYYAEGL